MSFKQKPSPAKTGLPYLYATRQTPLAAREIAERATIIIGSKIIGSNGPLYDFKKVPDYFRCNGGCLDRRCGAAAAHSGSAAICSRAAAASRFQGRFKE
jgi:hypothetical protein